MFSEYFRTVDGISLYPIISLMIFIPFFIVVTVWVFRIDKKYLKRMSELPLDEDTRSSDDGTN